MRKESLYPLSFITIEEAPERTQRDVSDSQETPEYLQPGSFINYIVQLINGQESLDKLESVVADATQAAAQHRSIFNQLVIDLGEEAANANDHYLENFSNILDTLDYAIEMLQRYPGTEDRQLLIQAADYADRAVEHLNIYFPGLHNLVWYHKGPTESPSFNRIIHAVEAYHETGDNTEALEILNAERVLTLANIDDLESSKPQEYSFLATQFEKHLKLLNALFFALEDKKEYDSLKLEFEDLAKSFQTLQEAIPTTQLQIQSDLNSKMPDLNYVLSVAQDFLAGRTGEQRMANALNTAVTQLQEYKAVLDIGDDFDNNPALSYQEQLDTFNQAVDTTIDCLYSIAEFAQDREVTIFEHNLKRYEESLEPLFKAIEDLEQAVQKSGLIPCVKCSHMNPPNRSKCEQCLTLLPAFERSASHSLDVGSDSPAIEEEDIPENIYVLYKATNDFEAQLISREQYQQVLEHFIQNYNTSIHQLPQEELDFSIQGLSPEENAEIQESLSSLFEEGLDEIKSGVEGLFQYSESEEQSQAISALQTVHNGSKKLMAMEDKIIELSHKYQHLAEQGQQE